ncbi:hypothetical protein H0N96_03740 [Candidatus Micrarchaeota archaeon]|nr:hypothetical protein [Candidatus Micrarchaeota archaeon]
MRKSESNEFKALSFACKYSFITNKLGYCGLPASYEKFRELVEEKKTKEIAEVKKRLESFYGLYAYLKLIARCNHLKPFDYKVIEAYWLGNELLHRVPRKEIAKMILCDLSAPGLLPKKRADETAARIPKNAVAHHSFHGLYVKFITNKLAPTTANTDKCIIKWGKIKRVSGARVEVNGVKLAKNARGLFYLKPAKLSLSKGIGFNARKGDVISIHWSTAIERLNGRQARNLKHYTIQNIKAVNSLIDEKKA